MMVKQRASNRGLSPVGKRHAQFAQHLKNKLGTPDGVIRLYNDFQEWLRVDTEGLKKSDLVRYRKAYFIGKIWRTIAQNMYSTN